MARSTKLTDLGEWNGDLPEHPSVAEMTRRACTRKVFKLEQRYKQTGNPLYIWIAIDLCARDKQETPKFCVSYITWIARFIHSIVERASTAEFTTKHPAVFRQRVTFQEAVETSITAIGISRKGFNAFQRLAADRQQIEDALRLDAAEVLEGAYPETGAVKHAVEKIKKVRNIQNDRVARSRARRGMVLRE